MKMFLQNDVLNPVKLCNIQNADKFYIGRFAEHSGIVTETSKMLQKRLHMERVVWKLTKY